MKILLIIVNLGGSSIFVNEVQKQKAESSIDFTDEGFSNIINFKCLQFPNADLPIDSTEDGITTFIKEHPANAKFPIEVTELGIFICVNEKHLANVKSLTDFM